jgi:hypothetical protein
MEEDVLDVEFVIIQEHLLKVFILTREKELVVYEV